MIHLQPHPRPMNMGAFTISPVMPGHLVQGHRDHGYGPLARFDLSQLDPGGFIPMHPHRNDEIVTYMLQGSLRHTDSGGSSVEVSPGTLMVMNAGRLFEHEEGVPPDAPITAKWIQIFIRPHSADLEPLVQFAKLPDRQDGQWRHLAGNEGSGAPALVRNEVDIFDTVATSGKLTLPALNGRHPLLHVWKGTVSLSGHRLTVGEGLLLSGEGVTQIEVDEPAGLLLFLIAPNAPVTHSGTISR
ncbi:MAG: pirin family protein [Alphaproteobacteria bacterium]|nr:pirin family protein [Alphaproteobacteria bacterium]MBU1551536.1 pirin family protein [Alphaproteobacteria bacterium]MBU2337271.1 pirin family protein [Alphaproteobacteria bacterium]MBU2388014.1 pirin family protein [Alphaproteobacteria bacterium]